MEINEMKHDRTLTTAAGLTFLDFLEWAKDAGESRDTILEIEKVGTRLDLTDEELGLLPADLGYFEKVVAVSPYGAVFRSKDLDTARNRGNSRVRASLGRFLAGRGQQTLDAAVRASHDRAIDFITEHEGFVESGALFSTSTHKPFLLVRARSRLALEKTPDQPKLRDAGAGHNPAAHGNKQIVGQGVTFLPFARRCLLNRCGERQALKRVERLSP